MNNNSLFDVYPVKAYYIFCKQGTSCLTGQEFMTLYFRVRGRDSLVKIEYSDGIAAENHKLQIAKDFTSSPASLHEITLYRTGKGKYASFNLVRE